MTRVPGATSPHSGNDSIHPKTVYLSTYALRKSRVFTQKGQAAAPVWRRAAEHERAKTELKALVPEDAREASGHGIRARRSKAGAIGFDVLEPEAAHAPVL
jgi:hypothetical protein